MIMADGQIQVDGPRDGVLQAIRYATAAKAAAAQNPQAGSGSAAPLQPA
jgi:hypothetical protein